MSFLEQIAKGAIAASMAAGTRRQSVKDELLRFAKKARDSKDTELDALAEQEIDKMIDVCSAMPVAGAVVREIGTNILNPSKGDPA